MKLSRLFYRAAFLTSLATTAPASAAEPSGSRPGKDFIAEARVLFRVAACTGDEPLPANLDEKPIAAYCAKMKQRMSQYESVYIQGAKPFIAEHRPASAPATVVYPFGGGDLLTALTTYPDAKEITTISLEHAGDPRRVLTMKKARLATSLQVIRGMGGGLLAFNDSKSETLMKAQRNDLPGEVSLFLIALAVHGYEPVSLRYFRLEEDGSIHYFEEEEISALEAKNAGRLKSNWTSPDFSEAFSNSEIEFQRRGSPAGGEVRVHRHIAANLHDDNLKKDPTLVRHLEKKGRVSAMTKAASYLLWWDGFSTIRDYLLGHMDVMISDSTGIPPVFAEKAGYEQIPFGEFTGSYLNANGLYNKQFRELWGRSPKRPLPFRYGYLDSARKYHMLITRPRAAN